MCQDYHTTSGKRNLFEPQDEPPDWETIDLPESAVLIHRQFSACARNGSRSYCRVFHDQLSMHTVIQQICLFLKVK